MLDHPEGGRFREIYRSSQRIESPIGADRSALTHIYFSLKDEERSRFHQVANDEVWNLYRGAVLLHLWDEANGALQSVTLSSETDTFCSVVPAGIWQAAEPLTTEALVGCSVAPGFEFEDFTLIDPGSATARNILSADPTLGRFIHPHSRS